MEILSNQQQLDGYLREAYLAPDKPLLVDEYLGHATELDVDAACDGEEVLVGAIMEHLEEAGIHSGDSTCFIPAQNIDEDMLERVAEQTRIIGLGLNIVGCFNIQFAIQGTICMSLKSTLVHRGRCRLSQNLLGSPSLELLLESPSVNP